MACRKADDFVDRGEVIGPRPRLGLCPAKGDPHGPDHSAHSIEVRCGHGPLRDDAEEAPRYVRSRRG